MSSDEMSGSQRAIKRPRVPPGPLADLKALLYQLYREAGTPRLDQVAAWIAADEHEDLAGAPGRDTIARIIRSAAMPPSQADLVTVVTVLAKAARWDPDDAAQRARDMWVAATMDSVRIPAGGVQVSEADPRRLGVHAAISVPGVPDERPPEYVLRDADSGESGVRAKVAAAARRGGFLLLVGGSSVGKTRCAFEAVTALLPDWWLVHPAGAAGIAVLAAAPPPRTVVWLDNLQRYLDGEHGLASATVEALLNAPGPVVIIGTIWPGQRTAYTALPGHGGADPHARQREVLGLAEVIRIDPEFSPAEKERAWAAAGRDPRIKVALKVTGYGLTQTLAAAPELVGRWQDAQTASPYGWAVLTSALDAARLGARAPLTAGFLQAAAPGYCTDRQQADAPDDWLKQALAYATDKDKVHGTAAALDPAGPGMGQVAGYTAADYLIQHASRERRSVRVPASTWDAALTHIRDPDDAARLADSARYRLLYRYAIPLYRRAGDAGNDYAVRQLALLLIAREDLDGLRALAPSDWYAAERLANLLNARGDLDGLRALADADIGRAATRLADLLADREDLDGLQALASAGNEHAAERLADLLDRRGDLDGLRALAGAGNEHAAVRLAVRLDRRGDYEEAEQVRAKADEQFRAKTVSAGIGGDEDPAEGSARAEREIGRDTARQLAARGDLDGLRALADADYEYANERLAFMLEQRGDLDELRARARAGDDDAARRLTERLSDRRDLDGLRALADDGIGRAAVRLADLLERRGDLAGAERLVRGCIDAGYAVQPFMISHHGGPYPMGSRLARLLERQGRAEEAERVRRFGLNPDGSIADKGPGNPQSQPATRTLPSAP